MSDSNEGDSSAMADEWDPQSGAAWDPLTGGCQWPRRWFGVDECGQTATAVAINGGTWCRLVCPFHRGVAMASRWEVYDPDGAGPQKMHRRE